MDVLANSALMPMRWITSIQTLTLTIQAQNGYTCINGQFLSSRREREKIGRAHV